MDDKERDRRFELADAFTKSELLKRMRSYVEAEAKRKDVEEWSIVGHIFGVGSGVASALWVEHIASEVKG